MATTNIAQDAAPTTPAQQAAIDHVLALYVVQEAELYALFDRWPATDHPEYRRLDERTIARTRDIFHAYRAIHRAYGGLAPIGITAALVAGHYRRLAKTPDAGELSELGEAA